MKQKDRVRIVREAGYKGYDKSLDGKCENPQKYGVRRLDEAQAAIEAVATAPEGVLTGRQGKRTGDRHKPSARISHRLPMERREQIRAAVITCGYGTVQHWLETCVYRLLTEAEKKKKPCWSRNLQQGQHEKSHCLKDSIK